MIEIFLVLVASGCVLVPLRVVIKCAGEAKKQRALSADRKAKAEQVKK